MNKNPGHHVGQRGGNLGRPGLRRGLLLVLLILSVLLQGCFLDRLITLRSQTCAFDENFGINVDRNVEIEFYHPVLLEKDMPMIWGASPTTTSVSDTGSTMHYLFQRVPGGADTGEAFLLEEFSLEFSFVPVDGELRLSKISSSDLPVELLLAANTVSLSDFDEIAEYACEVEFNPFTRSMLLPLEQTWFNELPSRDESIALFGMPGSTLDEGNGLVYEYKLTGSDAETHTAKLVVWFDEAGEKPLTVEAGFSRYQMQANLLTAIMKVQFKI